MPREQVIRPREVYVMATAMLSGQGKTPEGIASDLGISPPSVRKLRAEAIEYGWLRKAYVFTRQGAPEELIADAERKIGQSEDIPALADALRELTGGRDVRIHLCDVGKSSDHSVRLIEFGRAVAFHVREALLDPAVANVGVAYGETLANVIRGLEAICMEPPRQATPVTAFPIRGDAGLPAPHTPSGLAYQLAQVANGKECSQRGWRSPTAIPPVVPIPTELRLRTSKARANFERYLSAFPDYSECFGAPDALVHRAQLILTSAGPPAPDSEITQWMYRIAGFPTNRLPLVGDVAGIPILDSRLGKPEHERTVAAFESECLIGIRRQDFQNMIQQGGKCLVAAMGDEKRARCLLEVARIGMATDLLVDKTVAGEMRRLLRVEK